MIDSYMVELRKGGAVIDSYMAERFIGLSNVLKYNGSQVQIICGKSALPLSGKPHGSMDSFNDKLNITTTGKKREKTTTRLSGRARMLRENSLTHNIKP